MLLSSTGWSVAMLLATFVVLYCYVWWLNNKFDEILKELKKK